MDANKTNGSPPEWSGIEHVPRTLASSWHLLTKRMAELEMHGFDANERFAIRLAIDEALTKAMASDPPEAPSLMAIRWQGKGHAFKLLIDGQTIVDFQHRT